MNISSLQRWCRSLRNARRTGPASRTRRRRPSLSLEVVEDRCVPSGTATMIADINPGMPNSFPSDLVAVGSTTYFFADDGVHGVALWKSNGTAPGTALVKAFDYPYPWEAPGNLFNVNGTLFFTANDGVHGRELWRSDGTTAGTVIVKDINLGAAPGVGTFPYFATANGALFFVGNDGVHGAELWKSDGTEAGTVLVKDINPGIVSNYHIDGTDVNGTLYFVADDGAHGLELWKSDGTEAGTVLVKDINPGAGQSYLRNLTNVNGTLFFSAMDGTPGLKLWKSDGTPAGTVVVKNDLNHQYNFTNVNGTLFFTADDWTNHGNELWKSNGSAAGTVMVKDINPGASSYPFNLTNVNGTLFFVADDGAHGAELWKSDGTVTGTTLVEDLYPGGSWRYYSGYYRYGTGYIPPWSSYVLNSSHPDHLTNVNGALYFTAVDETNGYALWESDGTTTGTVPVADIAVDPGTNTDGLTNVNGELFFAADDGIHGEELWMLVDGPTLNVGGFPATITAGVAGRFTVTAKNADGSTNTSYVGTIHFSSSDPRALLPADYTFTAADGGIHTFDATLRSAGIQRITAADTTSATFAGQSMAITVTPAAASSLSIVGGGGSIGVNRLVTVTARDPYGNVATSDNGLVHVDSSDPATVLPADFSLVRGVGSGDVKLLTEGDQTLSVTDVANRALTASEVVTGTPAAAGSFVVTGYPSSVAGVAQTFTVRVIDILGKLATKYTHTVYFSSSDVQAGLPPAYTFTAADAGVHTFTATLKSAGSRSITVSDPVDGAVGSQTGVVITPAAAASLSVSAPASATAGVAFSATVTASDAYGNRATGYTGTVHFTSSDAKAVLPGNYTFTAADAGMHSFSAVLKTACAQSLTATDTASAAIAGAQSVTVNPAAASRLLLSAPATIKAGAQFSLTVTVVDAYGNVVTGYRGKIAFNSSDSTARLPKNYTFTATDAGVHTFTGLVLKKKGKQTFTVTDTLDSSLTASVSIDVL